MADTPLAVQEMMSKGIATPGSSCNLSTASGSGQQAGWQNDKCVLWVGGAEGYTNQILSMLDVYRQVQPKTLVMAPMRTEHAYPGTNPPQCLDDVLELHNTACLHASN